MPLFGGGAETWRGAAVAREVRPVGAACRLSRERSDLGRDPSGRAEEDKIPYCDNQQRLSAHARILEGVFKRVKQARFRRTDLADSAY